MSPQDQTTETASEPRFALGAGELWLVAGFLATVIAAQVWLGTKPEQLLVPRLAELNQLQLLAHATRPSQPEVLIVGTSRVKDGIHPGLLTTCLTSDPDQPVEVARLPVQGMRARLLEKIVEELIEPSPPGRMLAIGVEARLFYLPSFEVDEPLRYRLFGEWGDLLAEDPRALTEQQLAGILCSGLRGIQAPWNWDLIGAEDTQVFLDHLHEQRGLPEWEFRPFSKRQWAIGRALAAEREALGEDPRSAGESPLDALEVRAFMRLLDRLDQLPCEVAFFRMPVLESFDRDQAREYHAYISDIVPMFAERGFHYLDLNDVPRLRQPDYFGNPSHVNPAGRVEASLEFARRGLGPWLLERELPELSLDQLKGRFERIGPAPRRAGRPEVLPPTWQTEPDGAGAPLDPEPGPDSSGERDS